MMYGTIQRWGNSQAIRLPKGALSIADLKENDTVEIIASEHSITLKKRHEPRTLDDLFAGYDGELLFDGEFDSGTSVGREVFE